MYATMLPGVGVASSIKKLWWKGSEGLLRKKYAPMRRLTIGGTLACAQKSLDQLAEAESEADINLALGAFCNMHGVARAGHISVNENTLGLSPAFSVTHNLEDYNKAYVEENMLEMDAVRYLSQESPMPLAFGLPHHLKPDFNEERKFWAFFRDFGCDRGIIIPFNAPHWHSVLGLVVSDNERDFITRLPEFAVQAQIFGIALHDAVRRVSPIFTEFILPDQPGHKLSRREVECLHWAAAGKTAWEMSCILMISERTVISHIENSKKKLEAKTLPQAVARAVSLRLITV